MVSRGWLVSLSFPQPCNTWAEIVNILKGWLAHSSLDVLEIQRRIELQLLLRYQIQGSESDCIRKERSWVGHYASSESGKS